jgi:hypothetical protein
MFDIGLGPWRSRFVCRFILLSSLFQCIVDAQKTKIIQNGPRNSLRFAYSPMPNVCLLPGPPLLSLQTTLRKGAMSLLNF